jgi:hypothetical protein
MECKCLDSTEKEVLIFALDTYSSNINREMTSLQSIIKEKKGESGKGDILGNILMVYDERLSFAHRLSEKVARLPNCEKMIHEKMKESHDFSQGEQYRNPFGKF